jgi:hypothetical protein
VIAMGGNAMLQKAHAYVKLPASDPQQARRFYVARC